MMLLGCLSVEDGVFLVNVMYIEYNESKIYLACWFGDYSKFKDAFLISLFLSLAIYTMTPVVCVWRLASTAIIGTSRFFHQGSSRHCELAIGFSHRCLSILAFQN